MAKNISRKPFWGNINIDDKIYSIEFYPVRERIIFWAISALGLIPMALILYPPIDMVSNFFLNGRVVVMEVMDIIMNIVLFMWFFSFPALLVVVFIFKYLCEPGLLIRFFKGDYFLKTGFLGRKVIDGNLSELKDVEIKVEARHANDETGYYQYYVYCLSLKWRDGKQFAIGEFCDGGNVETVAKELSSRLKISYVVC